MQRIARSPRSLAKLVVMLTACALAAAGFAALGAWQVQRLAWKEALIARVERNMHAAPAPVPASMTGEDEYRRVQAAGRYDYSHQVQVAATTELGAGYWVLTPLRMQDGRWLLVNRGFVPPEMRTQVPGGPEQVQLVGLLRSSEPHGRFLQANVPATGRWYSRDVAAIAAAQGLTGPVAPFFIDEVGSRETSSRWPRPGLTVIRFPNDHLQYAATWFALAAMMAAAFGYVLVDDRRRRQA